MSTDRELMELAARAAGLYGDWTETIGGWCALAVDGNVYKVWQPLHDDGDALRLAVKLGIDLSFEGDNVVFADGNWSEFLREDYCAATRRAITRAAAAIGESMS